MIQDSKTDLLEFIKISMMISLLTETALGLLNSQLSWKCVDCNINFQLILQLVVSSDLQRTKHFLHYPNNMNLKEDY